MKLITRSLVVSLVAIASGLTVTHSLVAQSANDGKTIVTSPHKIFGPESNDLALQLRKAGISQVILAGMSAKFPGFDGFEAAFVNYRMIASDV